MLLTIIHILCFQPSPFYPVFYFLFLLWCILSVYVYLCTCIRLLFGCLRNYTLFQCCVKNFSYLSFWWDNFFNDVTLGKGSWESVTALIKAWGRIHRRKVRNLWSVISSNHDIFAVIFTSSHTNYHDEQICILIGPVFQDRAVFVSQLNWYMALRYIITIFLI